MASNESEATEVNPEQVLVPADRCDRCGAQAFVMTHHEAGDLLWCAHHAHEHEAALTEFIVIDQRDSLAPQPVMA